MPPASKRSPQQSPPVDAPDAPPLTRRTKGAQADAPTRPKRSESRAGAPTNRRGKATEASGDGGAAGAAGAPSGRAKAKRGTGAASNGRSATGEAASTGQAAARGEAASTDQAAARARAAARGQAAARGRAAPTGRAASTGQAAANAAAAKHGAGAAAKRSARTTRATGAARADGAPPPARASAPAQRRSSLGRALALRRVELGLSRRDVTDRAGLSPPYLSELERDRKAPSAAALAALARALELTPAELLSRAERVDTPAAPDRGDAALAALVRDIVRDELAGAAAPPAVAAATRGHLVGAALREAVLAAARDLLESGDVDFDSEGDIPIRRNDVMLFIRVLDEPASVLVFSPMLVGLTESTALLERLNELNANVHFVRFCFTHGGVVADIELFADPFEPTLVGAACRALTQTAEMVAPDLQTQYGGRLFFGDEHEPKPKPGTGGYL